MIYFGSKRFFRASESLKRRFPKLGPFCLTRLVRSVLSLDCGMPLWGREACYSGGAHQQADFWKSGIKGPHVLLTFLLFSTLVSAADITPLLNRAEVAYQQGRWVEARNTLLRASGLADSDEQKQEALGRLGKLNMELLLSPYEQPESIWLEVQPADTLGKIAKRAGTTIELLKGMNRLTTNQVRLGRRLKVLYEPFRIEIDKSENVAILYLGGQVFKQYAVSTGAKANTPVGEFKITDRIVHPDWWHPETKQLIKYGEEGHRIGTHWLGWDVKGFGIHGTDEPEKIGQAVSLGCVRLRNEDVAELFVLLPSGTPVKVRE